MSVENNNLLPYPLSRVILEVDGLADTGLFLLNYFLLIYGLELSLQVIVLLYSFFCYDEVGEPYPLVMIDFLIALLLLIELRSHYVARPTYFWQDGEMRFDSFVCVFSLLFIGLFFLAREGIVEVSKDCDMLIHVVRETTRLLRLPVFVRNFNRMLLTLKTKGELV